MKTQQKATEIYAGYVGLDWSSKEHVFCIYDPATAKRTRKTIPNDPAALLAFLLELRGTFGGQPVLLGLEGTRASILPILLQHDFLRIILINPKTASDFREIFRPSGAKSDDLDSYYICELIRAHSDQFRIWEPHDPLTRQLNACVERRRELVDLRTQIANALHSALAASFPQLLELLHCQLTVPIASHFLHRWSSLEAAQAAGIDKLRSFFYKNNVRTSDKLEERLKKFAASKTLLQSAEDREPVALFVKALAGQLEQLHRSIGQFETEIAELTARHPTAKLFEDLPGAGPQLKPRLAVVFGTQKNRFATPDDVTTYTGIAPIKQSSGQMNLTCARWVRPIFIHQTWIEHANCSIRRCDWAREFYQMKREAGKSHFQALRALAFKWIRVLHTCWAKDTPYNESIHLQHLENKSPKLWARLQELAKKNAVNN
jgi:transposase